MASWSAERSSARSPARSQWGTARSGIPAEPKWWATTSGVAVAAARNRSSRASAMA